MKTPHPRQFNIVGGTYTPSKLGVGTWSRECILAWRYRICPSLFDLFIGHGRPIKRLLIETCSTLRITHHHPLSSALWPGVGQDGVFHSHNLQCFSHDFVSASGFLFYAANFGSG